MNQTLEKILCYVFIISLGICSILFSHVLYVFGIEKEINILGIGGYEGIKSIFISILGIFSFIFILLYKYKNNTYNNRVFHSGYIVGSIIILSSILSIGNGGFWLGFSEKHHGGFYYLSLLFIYIALSIGLPNKYYKKILYSFFLIFTVLGVYGISQRLGIDPLTQLYETRVPLSRIFSTLGNANYLAGLCVMILPLSLLIENKAYKYTFFIFILLILGLTGSIFGIFCALFYISYLSYTYSKKLFVGIMGLSLILGALLFNNIGIEKIGSMKARPYMWISTYSAIIDSPKSLIIGNGPDTLQEVFEQYKQEKLHIYETDNYTADRSHNLFLDLLYFFGMFGGGIIIFIIIKAIYTSQDKETKASMILFLLFFSFNIPVSIHFILFIFLLSGVDNRNIKT